MNNPVVSTDNLFKIYALSNQIICQEVVIGKYIASIKWENNEGLFFLRIELTWKEITTLELFKQIGLFASEVGLVSEVGIDTRSAAIRMAVAVIRKEYPQTIVLLGQAIDNICDILKRCLTSDLSESDGLDNPNLEKSKDAAATKAVANYLSDKFDIKGIKDEVMVDTGIDVDGNIFKPQARDEIRDFYEKLKS